MGNELANDYAAASEFYGKDTEEQGQVLYDLSATAGELSEGKTGAYIATGGHVGGVVAAFIPLPGAAAVGAAVGSVVGGAIGLFGTTKGRRALREDAHRIMNFGRDVRDFFVDAWDTGGKYLRRGCEWIGWCTKRGRRRKQKVWNFENAARSTMHSMYYRGRPYIEIPEGDARKANTRWKRINTSTVWNALSLPGLVGAPKWQNTDKLYLAMNDQFQKARLWSDATGERADPETIFAYALHSLFKFMEQDKITSIEEWNLVLPPNTSRAQALRLALTVEGRLLEENRDKLIEFIKGTSQRSLREGEYEALRRTFG